MAATKKTLARPSFEEAASPSEDWLCARADLLGLDPRDVVPRFEKELSRQQDAARRAALSTALDRIAELIVQTDERVAIRRWRDALSPLVESARAALAAAYLRRAELSHHCEGDCAEIASDRGGNKRNRLAGVRAAYQRRLDIPAMIERLLEEIETERDMLTDSGALHGKAHGVLFNEVSAVLRESKRFTAAEIGDLLLPRAERGRGRAEAVRQRARRAKKSATSEADDNKRLVDRAAQTMRLRRQPKPRQQARRRGKGGA